MPPHIMHAYGSAYLDRKCTATRVDACDNAVRNSSGGPLALEDSVEGNRSSVGTPDSSLDVLELGGQLTLL